MAEDSALAILLLKQFDCMTLKVLSVHVQVCGFLRIHPTLEEDGVTVKLPKTSFMQINKNLFKFKTVYFIWINIAKKPKLYYGTNAWIELIGL